MEASQLITFLVSAAVTYLIIESLAMRAVNKMRKR